jgi:hypothetical protein
MLTVLIGLLIMQPIGTFAQGKCNCDAIIIPKNQKIPLYHDTVSHRIAYKMINDTVKEEYYIVSIHAIAHRWAKIDGVTPFDTIPKVGWIETKYLGIYPGSYTTLKLYTQPSTRSKIKYIIRKPEYFPLAVINCNNGWLHVEYKDIKGEVKVGWLAPEDQCANPYTTCN